MSSITSMKRISTRDMLYVAMLAALDAICAWITVPSAVPFTMQTFAVFLALGLLGGKRGNLSILVYLLLGLIGLPVFSGFRGGVGALFGTTGGYILGFQAAGLVYWLVTRRRGDDVRVQVCAMLLGLLVCYVFGTAWFVVVYTKGAGPVGLGTVLGWCVLPFVVPDVLKVALAVGIAGRLRKAMRL